MNSDSVNKLNEAIEKATRIQATNRNKKLSEIEREPVIMAEVKRYGDAITIPEGMKIEEALSVLVQRAEFEEQEVRINRVFNCFYLDGALALKKAMEQLFGYAQGIASFWEGPPQLRSVKTGVYSSVEVPWGKFQIPGIEGTLHCGVERKDEKHVMELNAVVKRKHEPEIRKMFDLIEKIVRTESVYIGKAIKVAMSEEDHDRCGCISEPEFMDLSNVRTEELIFSEEIQAAIETNVFTPIKLRELCKKNGIPFKRGILFAGSYGTGKTLAAMVTAKICEDHGVTFVYCGNADEFSAAIEFAKLVQPAVVFCEDIDKVLMGQRNSDMDEILNIVDGVDSKKCEIMVMLTTNEIHKIHPAMLRPGRLDAIINVKAPDAKAVEKLVRLYGRGLIADHENLTKVGEKLQGNIPAVIREAVERAKLSAIRLGNLRNGELYVSAEALVDAASAMALQLELLNVEVKREPSDLERAAQILVGSFPMKVSGNNNGHGKVEGLIPASELLLSAGKTDRA
jgi:transitional endoplasmic reticulum ATPase